MKEVYNIGLDIGTSSVGYAMTDEKGRLLRFHKRPTYGSVLFEEAQTAKERRQKRSARRRLARRRKRLKTISKQFYIIKKLATPLISQNLVII